MSEFCVEIIAGQKNVTIEIATGDFEALRQDGYSLCLAKKAGSAENGYDIVWRADLDFSPLNTLSWIPQFELFGASSFVDGQRVEISTNIVEIGLGQTSTLGRNGILGPATAGAPPMAMSMVNELGPIHPGLLQWFTWIDGDMQVQPIYATPFVVEANEIVTFEPSDIVLIWFEQDIETSTIFTTPRANAVEIDLTYASSATRLYSDGAWSTP